MRLRRRKPAVLASLPPLVPGGARPGSLDGAALEGFAALLAAVGESQLVLATGYEAKSAVALGLATAATVDGRSAVLVECDLAAPRLGSTLGLEDTPGLGEYLRREAEAAEILQPLVLAGPASGRATAPLACIVAGAPSAEGAALLGSDEFRHATAKLRRAYEIAVLDGPPLSDFDSLPVAAEHSDLTIACVAETPRELPDWIDGVVLTGGGGVAQRS